MRGPCIFSPVCLAFSYRKYCHEWQQHTWIVHWAYDGSNGFPTRAWRYFVKYQTIAEGIMPRLCWVRNSIQCPSGMEPRELLCMSNTFNFELKLNSIPLFRPMLCARSLFRCCPRRFGSLLYMSRTVLSYDDHRCFLAFIFLLPDCLSIHYAMYIAGAEHFKMVVSRA